MLQPPSVFVYKDGYDELFQKAVEEVIQYERASASLLQRRLDIGYARACRIIDQLEKSGVLGPAEGSKPREVLIKSPGEIFGENWEKIHQKEEDPFELPVNYKVPSGIQLSKASDISWGKNFSDVVSSKDLEETKVKFSIPLGFNDQEKLHTESLLDINNLIVAGNTLSRKENFIDTVLLTFLLRYDPSQLKLILIDPTHYLDLYDGIVHLLSPVIHEYSQTVSALRWTQYEIERRQKKFSEVGVRDIEAFNEKVDQPLPQIVVAAFCDLFGIELEDSLVRLTARGERTGIHTIIVVDRTSGACLPNTIKSNIPARIVFRLSSAGESKAIDVSGAEKLGPGEIIYKPNFGAPAKLKAIFTPEVNVKEVVDAVKRASGHD